MTETSPLVTPGRFPCPACAERFESVGDKKRHIRDTHTTPSTTPTKEQNR